MTTQFAAKGSLLVRLITQKFHQYLASTPNDEPTPPREPDNNNDSGKGLPGINETPRPYPQMKALDAVPVLPAAPTLDVNPNKFEHGDRFFLQTVDSILSDASSFDQSFDEYNNAQYDGAHDVKDEIQDSMDEDDYVDTSDVEDTCSSPLSDKIQRLRAVRELDRVEGQNLQEMKEPTRRQSAAESQGDGTDTQSINPTETDVDQNQAQEEDKEEASDDPSISGPVQPLSQPAKTSENVSEDNKEDNKLDQQPSGDVMQTFEAGTSVAEKEDRIFSSLDEGKRDELLMYIVQHPFVRHISEQQAYRRRFMKDIRREAGAAGMNKPDIALLQKHVWQMYIEWFENESAEPQGLLANEEMDVEDSFSVSKKKKNKEKRKREDPDDSSRKAKKKKKMVKKEKEENKANGEDASREKSKKKQKDEGKRKSVGEEESTEKVAKKRKKTKSHSESPVPFDDHADNVDDVVAVDKPTAPVDEATASVDESPASIVDLAATADKTAPVSHTAAFVDERATSVEEIAAPVSINRPETPSSLKKRSAPVAVDKYSPFFSRRTPSKTVPVQKQPVLGDVSSPIVIDSSDDEMSVVYQQSDDEHTDTSDCVIVKPEPVTTLHGLSSFPISPISLKAQALPGDAASPKKPKSRKQKPQRSENSCTVTNSSKADGLRLSPSQQVSGEIVGTKESKPLKTKQRHSELFPTLPDVVDIEDLEMYPYKPEQDTQATSGDDVCAKKAKPRKSQQRPSDVSSLGPDVANLDSPNKCSQETEQRAQPSPGDAVGINKSKSPQRKRHPSEPSTMGTHNDGSKLCPSQLEKRALRPASINSLTSDTKLIKPTAPVHPESTPVPDKTPEQVRLEKKREKFRIRRKQRRLRKKLAKANNGVLDQGQQSKQTASKDTGNEKAKPAPKDNLDESFWKLDF